MVLAWSQIIILSSYKAKQKIWRLLLPDPITVLFQTLVLSEGPRPRKILEGCRVIRTTFFFFLFGLKKNKLSAYFFDLVGKTIPWVVPLARGKGTNSDLLLETP